MNDENKNILIKKREGEHWLNLHPISKTENIFNDENEHLETIFKNQKKYVDDQDKYLNDYFNRLNIETEEKIISHIDDIYHLIKPTMTMKEIQEKINLGGNFKFLKGVYPIDLKNVDNQYIGYDLKSNSTFIFDEGVIFKLNENTIDNYRILNIEKKENITINGGYVVGDKYTNLKNLGEWGHGLSIRGSKNIKVYNFRSDKCWGDGIYIGQSTDYSIDFCENILLQNIITDDNRRQGISVTSVDGLYMYNLNLSNTGGTAPGAGIDFEPNNNRNKMKNIFVDNIYTFNNKIGIENHFANHTGVNESEIEITVKNFISEEDNVGMAFRSSSSDGVQKGRIVIENPIFKKNGQSMVFRWGESEFKKTFITVKNPLIFEPNPNGGSSINNYSPIRFVAPDSNNKNIVIGNVSIFELNIQLQGNTVPRPLTFDLHPIKNVNIIDPISLGNFNNIRINFGKYQITDKYRILINDVESIDTDISVFYSSEYRNSFQNNIKNFILSDEVEAGSPPFKILASNESGIINIRPSSNSRIAPLGVKGETLQLKYGEYVILERINTSTWLITETNKQNV